VLRTHVAPDTYALEWAGIPGSDTDSSCTAELDGRLAGLGVIGYMLHPNSPDGVWEQTWHAAC
jgi:hypothetical protein